MIFPEIFPVLRGEFSLGKIESVTFKDFIYPSPQNKGTHINTRKEKKYAVIIEPNHFPLGHITRRRLLSFP